MSKLTNIAYYLRQNLNWFLQQRDPATVRNVIFLSVDHYEPGNGGVDPATEKARVADLMQRFPKLGDEFRDSNGRVPQRTWFFPPHYHRHGSLEKLVELCAAGFGEIELHLHHGKQVPDTAAHLEKTIRTCINEYAEFGIFGRADGEVMYGFIHGDGALDNSRGGQFCGVNNEIDILRRTGCYADFTFPSGVQVGPEISNCIFYAQGCDGQPKGHRTGKLAAVGSRPDGLLIMQGPSHPFHAMSGFGGGRSTLGGLKIIGDHVPGAPVNANRVRAWVRGGVRVMGCDDVIFVKTSTHGAPFAESALGNDTKVILKTLDEEYNNGTDCRVLYMNAREVFNTIRAIEDGNFDPADPMASKDYFVGQPQFDTSHKAEEASAELQALVARTYHG